MASASDSPPDSDIDGAWKEAFNEYLQAFFALCLSAVHAEIDWARGFEFLDKELQKIAPQSETGRRSVDLLVRVWRLDGEEQWVLIHIEVQGQYDVDFPSRMFEYHYRIRDVYRRPVASFAVLADDNPNWKPDRLVYSLWGCSVDFRFPIIKLTDLAKDAANLEQSGNPFAVIILAHLESMQTAGKPEQRRVGKIRLIKSLYDRWGRDDVRKLVRLIDWLVKLPRNLELRIREEVESFEKEKQMPFVTSFERLAKEEGEAIGEARGEARGEVRGKLMGLKEGIALALRLKFGEAGAVLAEELRLIQDLDLLHRIYDAIERSSDPNEIRSIWAN
jgi:hypothetical protein